MMLYTVKFLLNEKCFLRTYFFKTKQKNKKHDNAINNKRNNSMNNIEIIIFITSSYNNND